MKFSLVNQTDIKINLRKKNTYSRLGWYIYLHNHTDTWITDTYLNLRFESFFRDRHIFHDTQKTYYDNWRKVLLVKSRSTQSRWVVTRFQKSLEFFVFWISQPNFLIGQWKIFYKDFLTWPNAFLINWMTEGSTDAKKSVEKCWSFWTMNGSFGSEL